MLYMKFGKNQLQRRSMSKILTEDGRMPSYSISSHINLQLRWSPIYLTQPNCYLFIYPFIRHILWVLRARGGLNIKLKWPIKLARNNPGPKGLRQKQPRAEMTLGRNDSGPNDAWPWLVLSPESISLKFWTDKDVPTYFGDSARMKQMSLITLAK